MNRHLIRGLAAVVAVTQLSCAAGELTPMRQSMPAARAGLRPEYRVFYDALTDYGDWVLIEPYGFLFRPRASFAGWNPYGDGFWVPTDQYGWVWVSAEPYGWATYHYGQWLYDSYQGWVWMPGLDWGPAWVQWETTDNYVGWAPLMPRRNYSAVPGGAFNYVATTELASPNLKNRIVRAADLGTEIAKAKPVENLDQSGSVTFNRGPSIEWVERAAGRLPRVKIEDVAPAPGAGSSVAGRSRTRTDVRARAAAPDSVAAMQRAAEQAANEARAITRRGSIPSDVPVMRPFGVTPAPDEAKSADDSKRPAPRKIPVRTRGARPDTTR